MGRHAQMCSPISGMPADWQNRGLTNYAVATPRVADGRRVSCRVSNDPGSNSRRRKRHGQLSDPRWIFATAVVDMRPSTVWPRIRYVGASLSDLSLCLRKRIRLLTVSLQFMAYDGNGGREHEDNEANCHIDSGACRTDGERDHRGRPDQQPHME